MQPSVSRKVAAYVSVAACALLLGVILGDPTLIALGAPFAAYLAVGFALAGRQPELAVRVLVAAERAVEGERVDATIELRSVTAVPEVELQLALPAGIVTDDGIRHLLSLQPNRPRTVNLSLQARHWGAHRLAEVAVRARDSLGLVVADTTVLPASMLRVYPTVEHLRTLVAPVDTDPYAGNRVARIRGDGIEFADIRPFVLGDELRRINWRTSARRQQLFVNQSHPERNSDVILFLDSFVDVAGPETGTLDLAVRAAASLAREYLEERDRVGVVGFGGVVSWLLPAAGTAQLYRIVDTLLETETMLSFARKDINVLPPRSLPPHALILALTPLLDDRTAAALIDLRARGYDLVVVDISPLPFLPPARGEINELGRRLWPLWREALRFRYEQLGVAVVEWTDTRKLAHIIEEARRLRRSAHRLSA